MKKQLNTQWRVSVIDSAVQQIDDNLVIAGNAYANCQNYLTKVELLKLHY